jgi:two-component system cell cycle sensor histidine kinase/response regulator CckA
MSNKTQLLSIVDDEHDIMCLFRDALSQIGDSNVLGFTDSMLALEHFKLNRSNYTLVLSDFRMPTMNGLELLTIVKAINPSVKTVLISAFEVNEEDFEQSNCVDAFLQKPISIPDLIDAVETQISTSHLA